MKINRKTILFVFGIMMAGMLLPFLFFFTKECIRNKSELKSVFAQYENILVKHGIIKKSPRLTAKIKYLISGRVVSKAVINGKKDWLFYAATTDGNLIEDYEGRNYPSEYEFELLKKAFAADNEYLKAKGIKFLLFVAPNKGNVYRELLPASIKQAEVMTTEYVVNRLKAEIKDFPIIFPQEELLQQRTKYQLYYPRDTHWNLLGAYIGYKKIMKDGFGLETKPLSTCEIKEKAGSKGDLVDMVELSDYFPNMKEFYISEFEELKTDNSACAIDAPIKKSVLVINDSFGCHLEGYLKSSFSSVNLVHRHEYKPDVLEKYKPDIVILETVGRLLYKKSCRDFGFDRNGADSLHLQ